jgi:hypothetical protein
VPLHKELKRGTLRGILPTSDSSETPCSRQL